MLVLSRKKDQALIIGDQIVVTVLEIKGDQVRLGITAPKDVNIYRQEIYLEIKRENEQALNIGEHTLETLGELMKQNGSDLKK